MKIFDPNLQQDVDVITEECLTSACYWPIQNPFTKNQNSWFLDHTKFVCGTNEIKRSCKLTQKIGVN